MTKMTKLTALALTTCLMTPAIAAAQSAGDWTLGFGLASVQPQTNNGTVAGGTARISDNTQASITFEYFISDNLGIEVLAATPFKHNISIDGLGGVGSTKHLPPTVSLQYHFPVSASVTPFVGLGVNYTTFFDETAAGPIAGNSLSISDSVGLAAHIGADFAVSDRSALRVDARWIDINADVKLNGTKIGEAKIDPWVLGLSYVMKF